MVHPKWWSTKIYGLPKLTTNSKYFQYDRTVLEEVWIKMDIFLRKIEKHSHQIDNIRQTEVVDADISWNSDKVKSVPNAFSDEISNLKKYIQILLVYRKYKSAAYM